MSKASSFLKIGITLATFNFSGNMPVLKDWWLVVIVKDSINGSLICCSNLVDNPAGPVLCLGLSLFIIFVIAVQSTGLKRSLLLVGCFR